MKNKAMTWVVNGTAAAMAICALSFALVGCSDDGQILGSTDAGLTENETTAVDSIRQQLDELGKKIDDVAKQVADDQDDDCSGDLTVKVDDAAFVDGNKGTSIVDSDNMINVSVTGGSAPYIINLTGPSPSFGKAGDPSSAVFTGAIDVSRLEHPGRYQMSVVDSCATPRTVEGVIEFKLELRRPPAVLEATVESLKVTQTVHYFVNETNEGVMGKKEVDYTDADTFWMVIFSENPVTLPSGDQSVSEVIASVLTTQGAAAVAKYNARLCFSGINGQCDAEVKALKAGTKISALKYVTLLVHNPEDNKLYDKPVGFALHGLSIDVAAGADWSHQLLNDEVIAIAAGEPWFIKTIWSKGQPE